MVQRFVVMVGSSQDYIIHLIMMSGVKLAEGLDDFLNMGLVKEDAPVNSTGVQYPSSNCNEEKEKER